MSPSGQEVPARHADQPGAVPGRIPNAVGSLPHVPHWSSPSGTFLVLPAVPQARSPLQLHPPGDHASERHAESPLSLQPQPAPAVLRPPSSVPDNPAGSPGRAGRQCVLSG